MEHCQGQTARRYGFILAHGSMLASTAPRHRDRPGDPGAGLGLLRPTPAIG
jgi:hypothetical protein